MLTVVVVLFIVAVVAFAGGWSVQATSHVCAVPPVVVCEQCGARKTPAGRLCDWPGCETPANRLRTHHGHYRCAEHKSL